MVGLNDISTAVAGGLLGLSHYCLITESKNVYAVPESGREIKEMGGFLVEKVPPVFSVLRQ